MPEKHELDRDMTEGGINRRMRKLSDPYQFWRSVERSRSAAGKTVLREIRGPTPTEEAPRHTADPEN